MSPLFHPEVIIWIVTSSTHSWTAAAVIVPKMAAKLTGPTPPPVPKTFVRVFVAFGGDWLELWLAEAAMVVSVVVGRVGEFER